MQNWRGARPVITLETCTDLVDTATIIPGAMQLNPSPVPLMVQGCNQESHEMFWDGDPTKQSFISVVGLSTPRVSRTRSRPSSAPARAPHTSRLNSPRKRHDLTLTDVDATEQSGFGIGGGQTCRGSRHQHVGIERRTNATHQREDAVEKGRLRLLEHRLHQLTRENACMRGAMLSKVDEGRLERLAQAQRRNHELIAALQAAKEGAEGKARRTQDRVRALQNELRKQNSQQEPSPVTQQQDISCSEVRPTESLASASRPTSAPRGHCQASSDSRTLPTAAGILTTSTTVGNNVTPLSTRSMTREAGVGGRGSADDGTSDGATARTTAGNGKDDERASPGGSSPQHQKCFVAARPETKPIARRTPSPKRRSKVIATNKIMFTVRPAVGRQGGSPADGSVPATLKGETFSKEKVAAVQDGLRQGKSQRPRENINKEAEDDGGNNGGGGSCVDYARSGDRSNYHDTAPKVLLAREVEAAVRREERAAAAREKEEQEFRLSSSFRAKELHATSGPDWATIKAHQDIVRKQRTRDRAAFLAATSSLPARMARHAAMQAVAEDRAGSKRIAGGAVGGVSSDRGSRFMAWNGFGDAGGEEGGGQGGMGTRTEEPEDIGRTMQRRQERWEASLAAAKASSRTAATRPRTPPMEKRRLAQEAKRMAREKAQRSAQEAAAKRRVEDEKRQFQRLVSMHRNNGSTFRETKASVRKAEETRLKIQQDLEREEQQRASELAEEARRREVSRAVREYVVASEARRREEHGAGPPLKELIRRKKDEKNAEFRERRRLNNSGLRQALRKRPNLLERQEKYAQQHSRRLAAQASAARDFLESSEGFSAAGRRALRSEDGGWMARAATDRTFSSKEKEDLGLPVVLGVDGNDPQDRGEELHGGERQEIVLQAEFAGKAGHAATSERSVDGSACSNGTPRGSRETAGVLVDEGGSATETKGAEDPGSNEHSVDGSACSSKATTASVVVSPRGSCDKGGGALYSGSDGGGANRKDSSSSSSNVAVSSPGPTDEGDK